MYKENFHVIMMTNNDNILLKYCIIIVNRINGFFCLAYTVFSVLLNRLDQ